MSLVAAEVAVSLRVGVAWRLLALARRPGRSLNGEPERREDYTSLSRAPRGAAPACGAPPSTGVCPAPGCALGVWVLDVFCVLAGWRYSTQYHSLF